MLDKLQGSYPRLEQDHQRRNEQNRSAHDEPKPNRPPADILRQFDARQFGFLAQQGG